MKVRDSYHTIIFAPDTLGDGGPLVQMPNGNLGGTGTQTTLSMPDPAPILYDHRARAIYFENPRPAKKVIGFRSPNATSQKRI